MVVEDGIEERSPRAGPRSSWLLVVAAFVLGLALGSFASPPLEPVAAVDAATEPTVTEGPTAPSVDEYEEGVSGVMPEFPDALIAVGDGVGSGHDHLLWPVGGPLIARAMNGGEGVVLDATGQFVAMSEEVPGVDGQVLTLGRFNLMRPVAPGVTGYAWHDSKSGQLAFTAESGGEWSLQRVTPTFFPSTVVTGSLDGSVVAAWGDWGFALQAPDRRVRLLNPEGELRSIESGVALASHSSGWILVQDEGLKLVSAGGGVRHLDATDVPTTVFAAAFSPDGNRVAVAGRFEVRVYDVASGGEGIALEGYPQGWLSWSSDSRFVVAPAQRGVLLHDLETGESRHTLVGHNVIAASARPLTSS